MEVVVRAVQVGGHARNGVPVVLQGERGEAFDEYGFSCVVGLFIEESVCWLGGLAAGRLVAWMDNWL